MPWPAGPVSVAGQELEVAAFGPGPDAAPTLLLLHEGLGCVALWRDLPERLAQATGMGVVAYSRAGYGQSSPAALPRPLDYMTREAREVVGPLLDALGLRRVVLLGHSDGATIAAEYAGRNEDPRVAGLVLIAPHFFTESMGLTEIAKARDAYETSDLRARMARYHRDPDKAFRGWNDAWLDPGFADWNVTDALPGISVPVLAVQGVDDQYGTLAQLDALAACAGPVERLEVPGARHAPHAEAPDVVVPAIADFARRVVG